MADRQYPHLVPQRSADGKLTGDFECSECRAMFRPHPTKQGALVEEFNSHMRLLHPERKSREDFSQAAARIVREATERD